MIAFLDAFPMKRFNSSNRILLEDRLRHEHSELNFREKFFY